MPLRKGRKNVGPNIKEFRRGATYKRTKTKFGAKKAEKQALAVSLRAASVPRSAGLSSERSMESYAKQRLRR